MRICFVGALTACVLERDANGGMEGQVASLAKAMAYRGHEVYLVDYADSGLPRRDDGVLIVPAFDPNLGMRGFRFLSYRLPKFFRILRDIRADVYYIRGLGPMALPVIIQANLLGAISIYSRAADVEQDLNAYRSEKLSGFSRYDRLWIGRVVPLLGKFAIRGASCIFTQHEGQREQTKKPRGKMEILPNIFVPPENGKNCDSGNPLGEYVIWIGNISKWKGVEELAGLANLLDIKIVVVGPVNHHKFLKYLSSINECPNIEYKGYLPKTEAIRLLSHSKMLIHTAHYEGFPNVFLEAWWCRKPVVSLNINPGHLFDKNLIAVYARGSIVRMAEAINELINDSRKREQMGDAGRKYLEDRHLPEKVCDKFEKIVNRLDKNIAVR